MSDEAKAEGGKRLELIFSAIAFVLGLVGGDWLNTPGGLPVDVVLGAAAAGGLLVFSRAAKASGASADSPVGGMWLVALYPILFVFGYTCEQLGAAIANALGPLLIVVLVAILVPVRIVNARRTRRAANASPDAAPAPDPPA